MDRSEFERLVERTAHRPETSGALVGELRRQARSFAEPTTEGLDAVASGLEAALTGDPEKAERALAVAARDAPDQPLAWYYLFAARHALGDEPGARESLERLRSLDPADPVTRLLALDADGEPMPDVTEEVRLENLRKFGSTSLLRNSYGLAVGAIFEAIRERKRARVLDVGVGTGAQMSALLGLLGTREHRVERLEVFGLDLVEDYLAAAGEKISEATADLAGRVEVVYRPLRGRIEEAAPDWTDALTEAGGLDVANASITLHEVSGEAKAAAFDRLRALDPDRLVVAEWNYCTENVLGPRSPRFLFNVRRFADDCVAAVAEEFSPDEARDAMTLVLGQAGGQVTCPAEERQECYLDAPSWKALLEAAGFEVVRPEPSLASYAHDRRKVGPGRAGWYLAPYRDGDAEPIALLQGVRRAP